MRLRPLAASVAVLALPLVTAACGGDDETAADVTGASVECAYPAGGSAAKDVFGVMWDSGGEPDQIVEQKGLKQISDSSELETAVDSVIEEQGEAADKVRGGDEKPIQFLMGQVMRSTKGKANPQLVNQLLRDKLKP